jgi:putative NADH-flavin reductase
MGDYTHISRVFRTAHDLVEYAKDERRSDELPDANVTRQDVEDIKSLVELLSEEHDAVWMATLSNAAWAKAEEKRQ